jgi:predicted molibdopterin-dependent oxidoreductase YjgC
VRLVPEADRIFVPPALEVNPADLPGLGLTAGGAATITSGAAELRVAVRADWRTPRGQFYLPVDPTDAGLAAFVRTAAHPEGRCPSCVTLTGIASAGPEGQVRP